MVLSIFVKNERGVVDMWAIRVNGTEIPYSYFTREVAQQSEILAYWRSEYGQIADLLFHAMGIQTDPKMRALDQLIKQELITQYSQKTGITIHPEYITRSINNVTFVQQHLARIVPLSAFNESGTLNMSIINAYLKQNGWSAQEFENKIESALVQLQMLDLLAACVYIPSFEVKQQYCTEKLEKQFSYLSFSQSDFLAQEKLKQISDEELQEFFVAQNTKFRKYYVPETRDGFIWKFKPENYALVVSDEDITAYYNDNKIKKYSAEPLKLEVKEIVIDKDRAASREQIYADIRNNPASEWNKEWRAVKPFARGDKKGDYEKNAFLLKNEGDISPIFQNEDGDYVLLQLIKRIPRSYKPLHLVKEDIRSTLRAERFKKQFVKDIKEVLRNEKTIESFIIENTAKKEPLTRITKNETKLSQELFSLKENHYGFYVENGIGIVVLLSKITDRYLPDLASIKDIVMNDLYEERAHANMKNTINNAYDVARTKSLKELASLVPASLHTTPLLSMSDQKQVQDLERKGLPLRSMLMLEKVGSLMVHHGEKESYLIAFDSIQPFDEESYNALQSDIKKNIESLRTKLFLDGIVASLHRNATIETNEILLTANQ